MNTAAAAILLILSLPVLLALSAIWRGFVLSILWDWFMVPYFALPPLSLALAIGIGLVVTFMTNQRTGLEAEKPMEGNEKLVKLVTHMVVFPGSALLIGWIVTMFLP